MRNTITFIKMSTTVMGTFINYIQPNDHIQPAFVFNSLTDGTLQLPETNVAFAISATGTEAQKTHKFIKDIIKSIITTYGTRKLQYSVIVYGDSVSPEITFRDIFKSDADLVKAIDSIPGITGSPSFDKALEEAKEQLMSPFLRPYAAKVGSLHCDLLLTCPDIFKNKDFCTFSIKYVSTRSLFQSFFARPHQNAEAECDAIEFQNLRFCRSSRKLYVGITKTQFLGPFSKICIFGP